MTKEFYNWADNPTMSGTTCDTDKLNECLMHLKYNNDKGDGLPLFTALAFDYVLTGDEALGWVLQGSTVTRTYPDAVDRIISEYDDGFDETITISDVTFTYRKALNGRRIADVLYKDQIDELYAKTGVADYYILDKEQQHFQLPRNKNFIQFTGDTNQVNDYIEAGLPNITGEISHGGIGNSGGAFQVVRSFQGVGVQYQTNYLSDFNASRTSAIYGKSNTVQPSSTLKLLYYKVGNTVSNTSLIDVENVLSDVQMKAENDLSNCTRPYVFETYQNGLSWYRLWSDGWIEQGGRGVGANNYFGAQLSFIKPFTDTNYMFIPNMCGGTNAGTFTHESDGRTPDLTYVTTGYQQGASIVFIGYQYSWYACGY